MTDMSDAIDAADRTQDAPSVEREFVDADGARWRVYVQHVPTYDRRSGMSLIFASDAAVRRVRRFPEDWASLPDEALAALSWES